MARRIPTEWTERRRQVALVGALVLIAFASSAGVAAAVSDATIRVSVDTAGGPPNLDSYRPSVSADGRFVAFYSEASDLVLGDTNDRVDVFVRDRKHGTTVKASIGADGIPYAGYSSHPSISADGRFVAFQSTRNNTTASDTQIMLRDLALGTTTLVSAGLGGATPDGDSYWPSVSADGRYVAFHSRATNLVAGDTNGKYDIFVRDVQAGTIWRVMGLAAGAPTIAQPNGDSDDVVISADGQYIAFRSDATNLVQGGTTPGNAYRCQVGQAASLVSAGLGGVTPAGASYAPSISSDGRFVAFASDAGNLVAGDGNGFSDVFVRDMNAGTTVRVSVDTAGGNANSGSTNPSISSDGRYIAFESEAGDLDNSGLTPGANVEIFRRDMTAGKTQRMSVPISGQTDLQSSEPAISGNGMHVAFRSGATNLIPDDGNSFEDIFVRTIAVKNSIYRFYHLKNGSHFYTPSAQEAEDVKRLYPTIYHYEGVAYEVDSSRTWQSLYRFYNMNNGTHFYTASPQEAEDVKRRYPAVYRFEGMTYGVGVMPGMGTPVYRFYNKQIGSHFYTASATERDDVIRRFGSVYQFEGTAFWLPQ